MSEYAFVIVDLAGDTALTEAHGGARRPFGDTTYVFCSFECAEAFARHPRAYVSDLAAASHEPDALY